MESRRASNPLVAGLLSAILPGLGQFYNRQWVKGAGFLLGLLILAGVLVNAADPEALQQAAASGATPDNLGQLFILMVLLLAVAVWSIADAIRVARQS